MKCLNLSNATGLWVLLVLIPPQAAAQSQTVFDNTPNLVNKTPEFAFGREYGDELALAGTARNVTAFSFAYYGNFTVTGASYTIRFYANDGTDAFPGAPTALRPGSLLWESGAQSISTGVNSVTLSVPQVVVPDKFTWSVTFNGLDGTPGKQAALMLANPATVGAILPGTATLPPVVGSYDDFWKKDEPLDDQSWRLYSFGFGASDPKGNFYAKVTAVPETRPRLRINHVGDDVVLSWPAGATEYILQRNRNLLAEDSWLPTTTRPTLVNGINYVTNGIVPGNALYRLQAAAPLVHPTLEITRVNEEVVLSWPVVDLDYILERKNSLIPSDNWIPTSTPPTVINGVNYVTNSIVPGNRVYRLRRP